jgi:hypothetical protein
MSYTVEVPATLMPPEFDTNHLSGRTVFVTTFAGGVEGRMVQISSGFDPFSCLTMTQLDVLIDVLRHAREKSLEDHRLYDEAA